MYNINVKNSIYKSKNCLIIFENYNLYNKIQKYSMFIVYYAVPNFF